VKKYNEWLNEAKGAGTNVPVTVNLYDLKKIMDTLADIYTDSTRANDVTPQLRKLVNWMFVWYARQRKSSQQPKTPYQVPEPSLN